MSKCLGGAHTIISLEPFMTHGVSCAQSLRASTSAALAGSHRGLVDYGDHAEKHDYSYIQIYCEICPHG